MNLVSEVRSLVVQAKQLAVVAVNSTLTHLCWQIGQRIRQEVSGGERGEYGKQIVVTLAKELTNEFLPRLEQP